MIFPGDGSCCEPSVSVLLNHKFSHDVKLLVGRKLEGEEWTLENVLKVFREEIEIQERCE